MIETLSHHVTSPSAAAAPLPDPLRGLRVLVALVCFGSKNVGYLKDVIAGYRRMGIDVDIVVTSNDAKDLGPDVEVAVGLPTRDPWSLPFAHKRIFAERVEQYDLFIFSEDDVAVTRENLEAFLRVGPELAPDEVAGFLRYEVGPDGNRSMPDMHGAFRWKPETAQRRNGHVVAEYTNLHAGLHVMTRRHLKRALAHGDYLRTPDRGEFDMACTAATDPYTRCGLRKVICLSEVGGFLVHHMSNRYAGRMGISSEAFSRQANTLGRIAAADVAPWTLGLVDPKSDNHIWAKAYDEAPDERLLSLIPSNARTALVVGGGFGAMETQLRNRTIDVTVLPLDPVAHDVLAQQGFESVPGTFEASTARLYGRSFDLIVLPAVLHLFPDARSALERIAPLVTPGGTLIASGPNLSLIPVLRFQLLGKKGFGPFRTVRSLGMTEVAPSTVQRIGAKLGFKAGAVCWSNRTGKGSLVGAQALVPQLFAKNWAVSVRRRGED